MTRTNPPPLPPTNAPTVVSALPQRPPSICAKVQDHHRQRDAIVYVRQSTLQQVANNRESTLRQYDLKHRAIQLGWSA